MAFSCQLYLKDECDGCGRCQEPSGYADDRKPYYGAIPFDEHPLAIDEEDEME